MQKQLTNLIIGVSSFVIIVFGIQMVLAFNKQVPAFDYASFEANLTVLQSEDPNYLNVQESLNEYVAMVLNHPDNKTINDSIYDVLPNNNSDLSFVSANDEQISEMAEVAIKAGYDYFGSEDVKMLNKVYALEERSAAYLGTPRSYLYFAITADEEEMVAISVDMTKEGYQANYLWERENASDETFVQSEINRMLFIYTNEVV